MGNVLSSSRRVVASFDEPDNMGMSPRTQEILFNLALLGVTTGVSYWLLNKILAKLDPTNVEKKKSQQVVGTIMYGIDIVGGLACICVELLCLAWSDNMNHCIVEKILDM